MRLNDDIEIKVVECNPSLPFCYEVWYRKVHKNWYDTFFNHWHRIPIHEMQFMGNKLEETHPTTYMIFSNEEYRELKNELKKYNDVVRLQCECYKELMEKVEKEESK